MCIRDRYYRVVGFVMYAIQSVVFTCNGNSKNRRISCALVCSMDKVPMLNRDSWNVKKGELVVTLHLIIHWDTQRVSLLYGQFQIIRLAD